MGTAPRELLFDAQLFSSRRAAAELSAPSAFPRGDAFLHALGAAVLHNRRVVGHVVRVWRSDVDGVSLRVRVDADAYRGEHGAQYLWCAYDDDDDAGDTILAVAFVDACPYPGATPVRSAATSDPAPADARAHATLHMTPC